MAQAHQVNMELEHERKDSEGQKLPWAFCPVCRYQMDAASCLNDQKARPSAGSVSLCMKCGEVLEFTRDMRLQEARLDTLIQLPKEMMDVITKTQLHIRRTRPIP